MNECSEENKNGLRPTVAQTHERVILRYAVGSIPPQGNEMFYI